MTLALLTLAVKVPDGLCQRLSNIGVLLLECVPDVVDADNIALAALGCAVQAEQADNIGVIAVEELASCGTVDADLVNLCCVITDIFHMTQDMAVGVLRDKVAQVGAKAHVGNSILFSIPLVCGEALEEDEALAVEEILTQSTEGLAQLRQREVLL